MGRKIYCDGCRNELEHTPETERSFTVLKFEKEIGTPIKKFELCEPCTNEVMSLVTRLPEAPRGSTF